MFEIGKTQPEDIGVGTIQWWLISGCYPLFWFFQFMSCCVHDPKPWHADGICREMTFKDVIFPPSYWQDDHHPEWRLMPPESFHKGKLLGHRSIIREEVVEMMVTHLGVDPTKASKEVADIRGVDARFSFLNNFIKTTYRWLWMSKVMIWRLSTIRLVHWSVTSCSWLAHPFLWTKVQPTPMW